MSETDELHRLLGEAGIEYKVTSCHLCSSTEWECDLGNAVFYEDHTNGYTRVTIHYKDGMTHFQITSDLKPPERYVTPAQAVAATVGRGTCEADETKTIKCWVKCKDEPSTERMELIHVMECSECGHTYEHVNGDYEFCPRCGKKRVDA